MSFVNKIFGNIKWWFLHRTFDKYHIIKTNLPPGYHDIDTRMLHSLFSLLVEYVENENYVKLSDWNSSKEQQENEKKVVELYTWWKKERPKREKEFEKEYLESESIGLAKTLTEKHIRRHEEDTEKMIELIKIRSYLWT